MILVLQMKKYMFTRCVSDKGLFLNVIKKEKKKKRENGQMDVICDKLALPSDYTLKAFSLPSF